MTRETKLGLLVGTGIILLIGIIISDHLSVVKQQTPPPMNNLAEQAEFTLMEPGRDALPPVASSPVVTFDQQPVGASPIAGSLPPTIESPVGPALPINPPQAMGPAAVDQPIPLFDAVPTTNTSMSLGSIDTPAAVVAMNNVPMPNTGASDEPGKRVHDVKAGESLWNIAKNYYGDGNKWQLIAKANPNSLTSAGKGIREGVRLVIPDAPAPAGKAEPATLGDLAVGNTAPATRTIKVEAGDTLAALAAKHLGSASAWPEFVKANSSQIRRPEELKIGMVLKVPAAPAAKPSTPALAVSTGTTRTYTVQAGDTLSTIAQKTLGDRNRWREIFEANRRLLVDHPNNLRIGQVLTIPAGKSSSSSRSTEPSAGA